MVITTAEVIVVCAEEEWEGLELADDSWVVVVDEDVGLLLEEDEEELEVVVEDVVDVDDTVDDVLDDDVVEELVEELEELVLDEDELDKEDELLLHWVSNDYQQIVLRLTKYFQMWTTNLSLNQRYSYSSPRLK
jgi:hypothetical protein